MYVTQALHRSVQQEPDRPLTVYRRRVRTFARVGGPGRPAGRGAARARRRGRRPGGHAGAQLRPLPASTCSPCRGPARWSTRSTSGGARPRSPTRCATPAPGCCWSTTRSPPTLPALREPSPSWPRSSTAGDGPAPDGTLSYEELIAGDRAGPGPPPRRRRLAGALLHRRHHRLPQGRDAHARQPGHLLARLGRLRHMGQARRRAPCTRRRCSTSPTWRSGASPVLMGGSHVIVPAFDPAGRAGRDRGAPGHRRAAGADDDPDAGRPPAGAGARPDQPAARRLRRLADHRRRCWSGP